ncbi:MAG: hypothetical protein F6K50_33505 [Moorea sp. SIO3I7]|uniref:hypothetical protein n=1 Tax=unclassified Moorena TaxID=2683338 RepID=UPI0013C71210|nr:MULTISPECIES: hypothetical protein [unclassified Moorena]NEO00201.1 hypothetical protein [Moorena sp. SIO3I7]NEO64704.1 hypothetical protein [Moorena sp. SIO4G2]NEO16675.1 hypothetical protein [Moorena sp. SIO3E8]NEP27590.1 hypothetical protein [Moorena sp. SIO3I6]NEP98644.1 hypothetical protein [Moorena sp. SIO3F7]
MDSKQKTRYIAFLPDPKFPIPDSRFPIPNSRFPIPDSLKPTIYFTDCSQADRR